LGQQATFDFGRLTNTAGIIFPQSLASGVPPATLALRFLPLPSVRPSTIIGANSSSRLGGDYAQHE
jgi:hypothetical protein